MCNFIGMEYLVALSLILKDKQRISLTELTQDGIKIIKTLQDNSINSIFLFSDKYAIDMVRNYSDCFYLENDEIVLKNNDKEMLMKKFISYLTDDIWNAAVNTIGNEQTA